MVYELTLKQRRKLFTDLEISESGYFTLWYRENYNKQLDLFNIDYDELNKEVDTFIENAKVFVSDDYDDWKDNYFTCYVYDNNNNEIEYITKDYLKSILNC